MRGTPALNYEEEKEEEKEVEEKPEEEEEEEEEKEEKEEDVSSCQPSSPYYIQQSLSVEVIKRY